MNILSVCRVRGEFKEKVEVDFDGFYYRWVVEVDKIIWVDEYHNKLVSVVVEQLENLYQEFINKEENMKILEIKTIWTRKKEDSAANLLGLSRVKIEWNQGEIKEEEWIERYEYLNHTTCWQNQSGRATDSPNKLEKLYKEFINKQQETETMQKTEIYEHLRDNSKEDWRRIIHSPQYCLDLRLKGFRILGNCWLDAVRDADWEIRLEAYETLNSRALWENAAYDSDVDIRNAAEKILRKPNPPTLEERVTKLEEKIL